MSMKRPLIAILTGLLLCMNVSAQELKKATADFSDYISLLKKSGYEIYSFDISSLKDETYLISFMVKEYSNGELVKDKNKGGAFLISNRDMIEDFPEESQKRILSEGTAYDTEKGIYSLSEKLTIGFCPAIDSLRKVNMSVVNMGEMARNLAMKPLSAPGYEGRYMYDIRPFQLGNIQIGEFTPLLLFGSYWYDEQKQVVRFCGENAFSPDMASPTLKLIPHYYVIGVYVMKKNS